MRPGDRDRGPAGRVGRLVARAAGTLVALGVAAACDGTAATPAEPVDEAPPPGADTYETAIAEILDLPDTPIDDEPPEALPVVFVVPIDEALGIDAQAAVIDSFATSHDVRFVDDLAAAVDDDVPGSPPRDDGIVLAVGTIDPSPPHRVRIEEYRTAADVDATLLTLAFVADRWVVTAVESVSAEALTDVG
ncbi:MAG: hypothetical protein ACLGHQ_02105 [Acidimicrobiia bacterium]